MASRKPLSAKPCPFCGGPAEQNSSDMTDADGIVLGYYYELGCYNDNCRVQPRVRCSSDDYFPLEDEWNTRADD